MKKIGKEFYVRLPKEIVKELKIKNEDTVKIDSIEKLTIKSKLRFQKKVIKEIKEKYKESGRFILFRALIKGCSKKKQKEIKKEIEKTYGKEVLKRFEEFEKALKK